MKYVKHPLIKKNKMESRLYQEEILGTVVKKDTMVCLPTALGKTNVAILLAAQRLQKFPRSRILVMAPTRPLVNQHFKTFKEFLNLPEDEFEVVTGVVKPAKREKIYREKTLIFATPQTCQKDLEKGRLNLKDFILITLDECHHAVGRYAYPYISKKYREHAKNPRILALTASPGATKEKIQEICKNIGVEAVEIRTEGDHDVVPYVKEKKVEWVEVTLPESFENVRIHLKAAYERRIKALKKWGFLHGRYTSKKALLRLQVHLVKSINQGYKKAFLGMSYTVQAIKLEHALGLLETQGIGILEKYFNKIRGETTNTAKRLLNDKEVSNAMFLVHNLFGGGSRHPKIGKLCSIVSEQLNKKPGSKIIIFANFRETVKDIHNVLDKIGGANPIVLIGQKEGLSQKQQVEVIRNFGEGEHNVLVCTSIGEEGLSIESADIAIFYESVPSEIRLIQRRGRVGRTKVGRIIILIAKNTRDEAYRWSAYHKERRMHGILYDMKKGRKQSAVSDF